MWLENVPALRGTNFKTRPKYHTIQHTQYRKSSSCRLFESEHHKRCQYQFLNPPPSPPPPLKGTTSSAIFSIWQFLGTCALYLHRNWTQLSIIDSKLALKPWLTKIQLDYRDNNSFRQSTFFYIFVFVLLCTCWISYLESVFPPSWLSRRGSRCCLYKRFFV